MHQSHLDCNAFLGGISKNYGTNYILSDHSDYVVIEADEFDRSFHWLRPWMSVITATDPDHLDIYGTKEAYLESFHHYTTLIQQGGALIIHKNLEMKAECQEGVKVYEYSLNEGDFHAENIRIDNGEIIFDFVSPIENVKDVSECKEYTRIVQKPSHHSYIPTTSVYAYTRLLQGFCRCLITARRGYIM